ncbi:uncharacterized protein LOC130865402 [Chionomys nivalis]|uniref:uncharacterized protein LOC130865402 n=1 Tax=Chionomys nivalis TaxID=269649 RepID=UPI0025941616|nr:uncharacterized protein LOC130865402 [Chionomys nivalis]
MGLFNKNGRASDQIRAGHLSEEPLCQPCQYIPPRHCLQHCDRGCRLGALVNTPFSGDRLTRMEELLIKSEQGIYRAEPLCQPCQYIPPRHCLRHCDRGCRLGALVNTPFSGGRLTRTEGLLIKSEQGIYRAEPLCQPCQYIPPRHCLRHCDRGCRLGALINTPFFGGRLTRTEGLLIKSEQGIYRAEPLCQPCQYIPPRHCLRHCDRGCRLGALVNTPFSGGRLTRTEGLLIKSEQGIYRAEPLCQPCQYIPPRHCLRHCDRGCRLGALVNTPFSGDRLTRTEGLLIKSEQGIYRAEPLCQPCQYIPPRHCLRHCDRGCRLGALINTPFFGDRLTRTEGLLIKSEQGIYRAEPLCQPCQYIPPRHCLRHCDRGCRLGALINTPFFGGRLTRTEGLLIKSEQGIYRAEPLCQPCQYIPPRHCLRHCDWGCRLGALINTPFFGDRLTRTEGLLIKSEQGIYRAEPLCQPCQYIPPRHCLRHCDRGCRLGALINTPFFGDRLTRTEGLLIKSEQGIYRAEPLCQPCQYIPPRHCLRHCDRGCRLGALINTPFFGDLSCLLDPTT